ncbi:cobalt-precorrin-6A reductase [Propionicimonas sp.]|uniref:cobalt-precorrin-6A reductase n=1 Tax=Propionicimonas sp. TaxID=1955623 RepID=UPI0039E6A50E
MGSRRGRRPVAENILLLGGTAEARGLAELLVGEGVPLVTSLAGDVVQLRLPPGQVRVGGFGGAGGLARYLRENSVTAVVDATHPFAERITAHAATACATSGVPVLRLSRPSWAERPDATTWHWVGSIAEARTVARTLGERVFLAIGRQSLPEFADWTELPVLARVVDAPAFEVPPNWEVLRARGPFTLDAELDLLRSHAIDVVLTKDSGGPTGAKLDAAAELGVPVVIQRRPALPAGVPVVAAVAEAAAWVRALGE